MRSRLENKYNNRIKNLRKIVQIKEESLRQHIEELDRQKKEIQELKNLLGLCAFQVVEGKKKEIKIKKLYTGLELISDSGEKFNIVMRSSGFEFQYFDERYVARAGKLDIIHHE